MENEDDFSDVNASYAKQMFDLSQEGQADYFVGLYDKIVRWDWAKGRFYVFREHAWSEDQGGLVRSLITDSIRKRMAELAQSKAGMDFLKSMGSASVQDGIYKLLKKDSTLGRSKIAWNPKADLLGVPNGVVDLRTGKLRDGRPEDLINIAAGVAYKGPGAITESWRSFVNDIMGGDAEMVEYLQRALGYSTTGESGEHLWFLCHGEGRNGKSVLLERCVMPALGDYADTVSRKVLTKNRYADGTTGELLELAGVRFALASEFSGEIDEERVKKLASGGRMIGRRAYSPNSERFWSTVKLWIDTNHLPIVNDDSEGFWRRLRALLFGVQFELNPAFEQARVAEGEAVLAWLVQGAVKYYAGGLQTPKRVAYAVASYREESGDSATNFSKACGEADRATVTPSELYASYKKWAMRDGLAERYWLPKKVLARRMRELRPQAHKIVHGSTMWKIQLPKRTQ